MPRSHVVRLDRTCFRRCLACVHKPLEYRRVNETLQCERDALFVPASAENKLLRYGKPREGKRACERGREREREIERERREKEKEKEKEERETEKERGSGSWPCSTVSKKSISSLSSYFCRLAPRHRMTETHHKLTPWSWSVAQAHLSRRAAPHPI